MKCSSVDAFRKFTHLLCPMTMYFFQIDEIFPQTSAFFFSYTTPLKHSEALSFTFCFPPTLYPTLSLLCFGGILAQLPEFSSMITFPALWKTPFLKQIQMQTQDLLILAM